MNARTWMGGYGYTPPAIYKGPSASLRGSESPDGLRLCCVGGVIYKTRTRRGRIRILT